MTRNTLAMEDAAEAHHDATGQESLDEWSLLDHLVELRRRVVISVVAVLLVMGLCWFVAEEIYAFLVQPLLEASGEEERRLIFTGLTEAFFTYLKLSFYAGLALAFPIVAAQFYLFLAPGLYRNEKSTLLPYLLLSPLLFLTGAALAYYYVFPLAWQFFLGFESPGGAGMPKVELEARISEYLTLVIQLTFAFGLAFQLPVVLMLLARLGVVTPHGLAKGRKFAIVGVATAAAVFTPPDVISQIALGVPLYILYEVSIILTRISAK